MTIGHSTTPLSETLGFKPGMRLFVADMPDSVRAQAQIDDLGLEVLAAPSAGIDAAHVFVTDRATLERELNALCQLIAPSGFIWVSWPAQADSEVDRDVIRDVALPIGLSGVAECAVDGNWSALKLMPGQAPSIGT